MKIFNIKRFNHLTPLRFANSSCGTACSSRNKRHQSSIFNTTQMAVDTYTVFQSRHNDSGFVVATLSLASAHLGKVFTVFLLSAISMSSISFASDNETSNPMVVGENEHNKHCVRCHGSEVYTREDRFVKSMEALSKQVARCKNNLDVPWFDEDTEAVVQFLNNKYYRF